MTIPGHGIEGKIMYAVEDPLFKNLPPVEMVPHLQMARNIIFPVRAYGKPDPHPDLPA